MKRCKIKPGPGVVILATNGVVILALIGAARVIRWIVNGIAHALVVCGSWEPEAAAKSAPWILFALASGLAMSLYGMYEENQQYKRNSPYGRVERTEARSAQNGNNRKAG